MKFKNSAETFIDIEKYLKAGRFTMAILSWEDKDNAITNELVGKYDPEDNKWYIYIKNPSEGGEGGGGTGDPDKDFGSISTEADVLLDEFLQKFLEVAVVRKYDYEPGMWFMLREDGEGGPTTVNNQEVIDQFYDWVDTNYDQLKPYILNTYHNKTRDILIPYVGTRAVFYDLGKFVENQPISNLDVVISALWKAHTEHRDTYASLIDTMQTRLQNMDTNMTATNNKQNADIATMQQNIKDLTSKFNDIMGNIEHVADTNEMRIRSVDINVPGAANMIYPVKLKYTGGGFDVKGGKEVFLGTIFLTQENDAKTTTLQIGNDHATTSGSYYNGVADNHLVLAQSVNTSQGNKWYIYDVDFIGSGEYMLMLRGGTKYKLWSKYIDDIQITNTGAEIDGNRPFSDTILTRNPALTDNTRLNDSTVVVIDNSIHITNSIIIGNKFRMSIK